MTTHPSVQVQPRGGLITNPDMQAIDFQAWPKTPRLFRDMIVTEKIDGTNAAVVVMGYDGSADLSADDLRALNAVAVVEFDNRAWLVGAQSRKRMVFPGADNYGFAAWVKDNAYGLAVNLGAGLHYGEWWGSGIQRGYDLPKGQKVFSLFNVHRYEKIVRDNAFAEGDAWVPNLRVVPTLYVGPFATAAVKTTLVALENNGSTAAPGYNKPEGVIVFHSAARSVFKALLENDDQPKGEAA